jgi:hypothetical protein
MGSIDTGEKEPRENKTLPAEIKMIHPFDMHPSVAAAASGHAAPRAAPGGANER